MQLAGGVARKVDEASSRSLARSAVPEWINPSGELRLQAHPCLPARAVGAAQLSFEHAVRAGNVARRRDGVREPQHARGSHFGVAAEQHGLRQMLDRRAWIFAGQGLGASKLGEHVGA